VQLQRTLKYPFHLEGVGLHTGSPASVTVWPGEVDSGIAFFRRDVEHRKPIAAVPKNVTSTRLSTAIGRDGVSVLTIEHLMSSLYGLGIDNARL